MLGTSDGVFSPDRPLTRGMFATILARYAKLQGKDMSTMVDLSTFADAASIPNAYADGVRWCAANKIVEGRSDGTFASSGQPDPGPYVHHAHALRAAGQVTGQRESGKQRK